MILSATFYNYRNLQDTELRFNEKLTLFVGDNGQGKTNLAEALVILCRGKGFRQGKSMDWVEFGQEEMSIRGQFQTSNSDHSLLVQVQNGKKKHLLDAKPITVGELSYRFPSVHFSPDSLSAIKGSPEQRRDLLDEVVFDMGQGDLLSQYTKILASRNKALKKNLETPDMAIKTWLDSIEPLFFKLSLDVTMARKAAIQTLLPDIATHYRRILNEPVDISVEYLASGYNLLVLSPDEIEKFLNHKIQERKEAELAVGTTLVGPHRHEMNFQHNKKDARYFCSQGQQRTLILAFKMAQIVYHQKTQKRSPLLILDDVLSELDPQKRRSLVGFLNQVETQTLVTTTDLGVVEDLLLSKDQIFHVEEGKIRCQ